MSVFRTRAAAAAGLLTVATLSAACTGTGNDGAAASSSSSTPGIATTTTPPGGGTAATTPASTAPSSSVAQRPSFVTAGVVDCAKVPADLLSGAGFGPAQVGGNSCWTPDAASNDSIFIGAWAVDGNPSYWTRYAGASETIPGMPAWRLSADPNSHECVAMYKTPDDDGLVVLQSVDSTYLIPAKPGVTPICDRLPDLARALAPALP